MVFGCSHAMCNVSVWGLASEKQVMQTVEPITETQKIIPEHLSDERSCNAAVRHICGTFLDIARY